jgi:hypothetical protein
VATRTAIDKGLLSEKRLVQSKALLGSGSQQVALQKIPAALLVQAWSEQLAAQSKHTAPLTVHFLFVDTEQSCGLTVRGGIVLFEATPATHSDARVVTTRATFYALLIGELDLPAAQQLDLLHIEGAAGAANLLPGQVLSAAKSK